MKVLGCGVIGCGNIASTYHLPALARTRGVEIVAVCDLIEERAIEAKEKYGAKFWSADYREVLERDDIDLVCIFTKIECHTEISVAAAQKGKHVFVQKPFAETIADGERMIRVASENNVRLIPSFMHHYFDASLQARNLIKQGKIGTVEFIRFRNATGNSRSSVVSYGGAFMDIGAHGIDLIRFLSGAEIEKVCSRFTVGDSSKYRMVEENQRRYTSLLGNEVNAWMMYALSSGATVSHEIQWSQVGGTRRFEAEIYGTDGTIFLFAPETGHDLAYSHRTGNQDSMDYEWEYPDVPDSFFGMNQHQAIVDDLLGLGSQAQDGSEGLAVLKVCEAARRSATSGSWVEVLE